ncbi:MAG: SMC family ATPase [Armatimonadota bacterium]|nr:SMC family ATPase [Armatimonadota bacterium]MDR7443086.1 SMC family ATPase [Armatimonadota bacterium]MDR7571179.1 SMC family ATPase [Armatimonadota bacterium]MDR7614460.1 SMC family ATPase [Armatimonadota bacterium]
MRPLKLLLEGFTCFKEGQTLDFASLDLFAITGPTGAGKTSLLDAMIFALYGRIPRVSRRYAELISLGRDRMSVVLEFRVLDRRFRVGRVGRRGGPAQAILEEILDGGARVLASGVREVDRAVQDLLGLPYEAFTQAVVLPQGEFATFLKSPPGERREILRNLLRLQVYERMRQLAQEERQALEGSWRGLLRLCEEYADATPQALRAAEEEVGRLRRARDDLGLQLRELERRLEVLVELRRKTAELETLRERERALDAQEKEVRRAAERLRRAERAKEVLPQLAGAEWALEQALLATRRAEAVREELEQARRVWEQARRDLARAEEEARRIPALRARIRALDELRGIVEACAAARSRLEAHRSHLEGLEAEVTRTRSELERLEATVRGIRAEVEAAEESLRILGYEESVDRLLEEVSERAAELRQARAELERMAREAEALETEARRAHEKQVEAERATAQAQDALRRAAERAEAWDRQVQEVRMHHAAHALRARLRPGEPCPVCAQPVVRLPPQPPLPELERLEDEARRARQDLEQARQDLERAAAVHAAARAAAEEKARGAQQARERCLELREQVHAWAEELEERVGPHVAGEPGKTIEERIREALRRVRDKRRQHARAKEHLEARRRELLAAQERARHLEDRLIRLQGEREEVRLRLAAEEEVVRGYERRVREVTDAEDPLAERDALEREAEGLLAALAQAREAATRAEAEADQLAVRLQEAEQTARRAQQEAEEQKAQAEAAARKAGFRDLEAVREAALAEAEGERLRQLVETYEAERRSVRQQLRRLERELGEEAVTEEALQRARKERESLEAAYREAVERVAAAEQNLVQLRERVERAERLRKERAQLEAEYTLIRQLADDLRSEHFQEFVLEETFRELVAGASVRLLRFSHRYTLEYGEDGSFAVVDHDNAGERRSADTLSGGETFLASLSLALELSEQVQRSSGAVALHSLFIDEGFGTLDPETLDHVACAIEALQTGGRMVGIVTHLQELSARLPTRVVVEKRPEGSRVRVVTD